jgi:hypothetical protein
MTLFDVRKSVTAARQPLPRNKTAKGIAICGFAATAIFHNSSTWIELRRAPPVYSHGALHTGQRIIRSKSWRTFPDKRLRHPRSAASSFRDRNT